MLRPSTANFAEEVAIPPRRRSMVVFPSMMALLSADEVHRLDEAPQLPHVAGEPPRRH